MKIQLMAKTAIANVLLEQKSLLSPMITSFRVFENNDFLKQHLETYRNPTIATSKRIFALMSAIRSFDDHPLDSEMENINELFAHEIIEFVEALETSSNGSLNKMNLLKNGTYVDLVNNLNILEQQQLSTIGILNHLASKGYPIFMRELEVAVLEKALDPGISTSSEYLQKLRKIIPNRKGRNYLKGI